MLCVKSVDAPTTGKASLYYWASFLPVTCFWASQFYVLVHRQKKWCWYLNTWVYWCTMSLPSTTTRNTFFYQPLWHFGEDIKSAYWIPWAEKKLFWQVMDVTIVWGIRQNSAPIPYIVVQLEWSFTLFSYRYLKFIIMKYSGILKK